MTDDLFPDDQVDEGFVEADEYEPIESNKGRAARLREESKRQKAESEALIARANLKAELRAELEAEMQANGRNVQVSGNTIINDLVERHVEPSAPESQYVANFWAISPYHEPRLLRPGSRTMIHFKNGFFRAENESDANMIRQHLLNYMVGEEDMPANYNVRPDKDTGFAPRSNWALEAFREFRTMEIPTSMFGIE